MTTRTAIELNGHTLDRTAFNEVQCRRCDAFFELTDDDQVWNLDGTDPAPCPSRSGGELAAVEVVGIDVDRVVSDRTRERIERSVPENTRRAYGRQLERFEAWCGQVGRTAYPCTGETLAEFVSHLCDLELGASSIDQAITAIRVQHRNLGFQHQPDTRAARMVLKTHRRERSASGERTKKAPPITIDRLRRMIEATPDTLIGRRDAALLVLGFALMGRRSELAALQVSDVLETDDGLLIRIRSSKTDQDAAGADVAVPRGVHSATDPVRVMRRYLAALAERGVTSGPLLRSVNRHGQVGASISPDGINRAVRAAAERAGLSGAELYSAHGLRAGGATSAYKAGAPVSAIAAQGRWSERSTAVLGYIRAVDQWDDNPMRGVGL
ncbi:MAG TPA: tyrosine-type recombinase/integrase [Vicinamibacterales bacterium]|jgi:integrase|nr:tyrosine-type recombinase/integrase [Vicinamibacterales bacterium]